MDASKSLGLSIIKGADGSAYPAAVKSVTKDSQADVAGVKPGMHVHAIQNQSCIDKDLQWVLSHIKSAITAKKPFEIAFLRETDNLGAFEHMIFEVQSSKLSGLSIVKAEEKSPYPATIKRVTQGQQGDSGGVKAGMHIHAIDGVDCIGKSLKDVLVMVKAKAIHRKIQDDACVRASSNTNCHKTFSFWASSSSWASTFATKEICCLSTTKYRQKLPED